MRHTIGVRRSLGVFGWVWICVCGCFLAAGQAGVAAPPTVMEVLAPLKQQREALLAEPSWTLAFTVVSTVHVPGTYAYSQFSVTDRRRGSEYHVTTKYPPGSLLVSLSSSSPSPALPADPPRPIVEYSYLGGTAYDRDQYNLRITPAPLTQHFQSHDYTDYQHINTYKGLAMPAGRLMPYEPSRPYVPDVVLGNLPRYVVRDQPEVVQGASCFVVENPGVDAIWIDEAGNLRQRVQHWGPGEALSLITSASDFRERKAGIWLPEVVETQHFDNPQRPTPRVNGAQGTPDLPNFRLKITLDSVSFEPLTDQDLSVAEPVAGVRVTDLRGKTYLSNAPIVPPATPATATTQPAEKGEEGRSPAFRNLWLAVGLSGVFAVSFFLWQRQASRSRSSGSERT